MTECERDERSDWHPCACGLWHEGRCPTPHPYQSDAAHATERRMPPEVAVVVDAFYGRAGKHVAGQR